MTEATDQLRVDLIGLPAGESNAIQCLNMKVHVRLLNTHSKLPTRHEGIVEGIVKQERQTDRQTAGSVRIQEKHCLWQNRNHN